MKLVYSQWSLTHEPFKAMAACSNYLAKSHGYKTILYTDEKGREDFKNISFSEIRLFPDSIAHLPKNLWSLGKVLAMSLMDEPFFHIDQDVFLFKNILEEYHDKDFVVYNDETYIQKDYSEEKIKKEFPFFPKSLEANYELKSHNFGLVGGLQYKELSSAADEIIKYCIENKREMEASPINPKFLGAVIVEQIWISGILKKLGIFPCFLTDEDIVKPGILHMSGIKNSHHKNITEYAKRLGATY